MRWSLALAILAACTKEPEIDENCAAWTVLADSCLEESGQEPAYTAGVDCTLDPQTEARHRCILVAWEVADCSTEESVTATELVAYDCTQ